MLGLYPLGTAALGTDGTSIADGVLAGVTSSATAGALSGNNASIGAGSGVATGAVGVLSLSQFWQFSGITSASAVGVFTPSSSVPVPSVSASASVGSVALSLSDNAVGAASTSAIGELAGTLNVAIAGASTVTAIAPITPMVAIAIGAFPITSDGVLGLWTLGDASLVIDAPPESWFSGVAGVGVCGPAVMIVNNSVEAIGAAGAVTANPSANGPGVAAITAVSPSSLSLMLDAPGVAATALLGEIAATFPVPLGPVAATGSAGAFVDSIFLLSPGVSSDSAFGLASMFDPSTGLTGSAASGAPGTLFSLSPSSAFGLWGSPVPGGTVTVTFAGLPSVAVTIGSGQTLSQVASALAGLINSNATIVSAGISVRTSANIVELHQPQPALISSIVSMTGT